MSLFLSLTHGDPKLWSEWEVSHWLDWCQAEFSLHGLGPDLRGLPGSELCTLDRDGFLALTSDCTAGEILWEHLETMRNGERENTSFNLEGRDAEQYTASASS